MAYYGNPLRNHNLNPPPVYSQTPVEANVYDLDDPYLMSRVISQQEQHPRAPARSITCRFLAIPINEPYAFFHNLAQYGHVIHESRNKLIMRLPYHNLELLNHVRQVWVSKYLAPLTECRITFDLPRQDPQRTTMVIIQRVLPRLNRGTAVPNAAVYDGPRPIFSGGHREPRPARRRRATSVPSPEALEETNESPSHLSQSL